MHMVDFEYNGETLSSYGCMPCSFDSNEDTVDVANSITINTVKPPNVEKLMATGSSYEDPLKVTFSICSSYTCENQNDTSSNEYDSLTDEKINEIMRWLNRRGYYKFSPIYDDDSFEDVFFYGTFNAELVKMGEMVVGFNLTLQTNAPYGFVESPNKKHTFKDDEFIVRDTSDEVGVLYADVIIKCLEDGDLVIRNSLDPYNSTVIKNCSANEVIALKGEQKIITSSEDNHATLYNDFNYHYIRIKNTYDTNKNVFTSTLNCEMSISYYPVRKVGIII